MIRRLFFCLLCLAASGQAFADVLVPRDTIGTCCSLTDGLGGGGTHHDGPAWNTSGLVLDVPETGLLTQARFVIFSNDATMPENNIANILGLPMEFHLWTEGILGGTDSFDQNPRGFAVGGHIDHKVNSSGQSFITAQAWGNTGPAIDPNAYTTFLITVDLSSFAIELQGGQQYVMGLIQDNANNFVTGQAATFRISGSTTTGPTEDLYRNTNSSLFPGYISSQAGFNFEQLAGSFTLGNGDYDGDYDVDGDDFLILQRNLGQSVPPTEDSNGDGIADGADLAIWESQFGNTWPAPLTASATVPEPTTSALALAALCLAMSRRRAC